MSDLNIDIKEAKKSSVSLRDMANAIRALTMDAVQKAQSGHPGMPMGAAEMATVLYTKFLRIDPLAPDWPDRDRFVLSAGHGSMLQYALHYLMGFADMTLEEIKNFRQLGARTAGHPEFGHAGGIETTTGPLGQGIATAVGMALGERLMNARFGDELVDHFTYVMASDGDLMEGVSHEAASIAGHLKLARLIVLYDDNEISIDGPLSLTESGDAVARFAAAGWDAVRIDGHDMTAIEDALQAAREPPQPSLIACRTVIGKGAPRKQGTPAAHSGAFGEGEIARAHKTLGWAGKKPFDIPSDILDAWRVAGRAHVATRKAWEARLDAAPIEVKNRFCRVVDGKLPVGLDEAVLDLKKHLAQENRTYATRQASHQILQSFTAHIPEMVGGSADLTESNNVFCEAQGVAMADDFAGAFVHWGVREHGMAAAMNGLARHGGFIPYGGTFLVFSDYARPAIRLSALMKQRVIYVCTHDSIGLGEDGPTHQPIEHLAALRAIPNLLVLRPADAIETLECWQVALKNTTGPSVLVLTRQAVPPCREFEERNLCAHGGYELAAGGSNPPLTLLASGSEVAIALAARERLRDVGLGARVVSVPCMELFAAQTPETQADILGETDLRIAIEAAVRQSWDRFLRPTDIFIGMDGFGASAPADQLFTHFGITAEAVVEAATSNLENAKGATND